MWKKILQILKEYWVPGVFIGAYLVGSFYGLSGIESSLFGMVVLILLLIQKEAKEREGLEKRMDEIINNIKYRANE
jgi:hypothetical protein